MTAQTPLWLLITEDGRVRIRPKRADGRIGGCGAGQGGDGRGHGPQSGRHQRWESRGDCGHMGASDGALCQGNRSGQREASRGDPTRPAAGRIRSAGERRRVSRWACPARGRRGRAPRRIRAPYSVARRGSRAAGVPSSQLHGVPWKRSDRFAPLRPLTLTQVVFYVAQFGGAQRPSLELVPGLVC